MPAEILNNPSLLAGFLLTLVRMGSILVFVPIPGSRSVAEPVKALLVLSLTVTLYPLWPRLDAASLEPGAFLVLLGGEMLLGTAVGLLVGFLSESLVFGVQAIVVQAGFSYASSVDPSSQADSTVLQILTQLLANLLFFSSGVDHLVLRTMARSLETCPPGHSSLGWPAAHALVNLGGAMLELALRLALPVAGLLLLTDVTLALVSRLQAQLQLLSLAFPVKLLGSLLAIASLTPLMAWIYRAGLLRVQTVLPEVVR